jgi:nucleotide-binding universal stress UspA family protein
MEGEPGAGIASIASSKQADLIVMGAYRHTQLLEWATHSTLNAVPGNVNLPILAIK